MGEKADLEENASPIIKTYRLRWLILTIFVTYNTLSSLQFIQYSIITNVVTKYYNVSVATVDWTTIVFMLAWPTLMFPAAFIIDRMGLRVAALIGAGLTALGALVKVASVHPDLFYVVIIGQTLVGISQIFILCLPQKIARNWFPPEEVSRVCALGVFGLTLGSAIGFLVPPIMVQDHDNIDDIGSDLNTMCITLAAFCVPVAVIVIIWFPKEPPYPPSVAQYNAKVNEKTVSLAAFLMTVKILFKNGSFLIHMISFSCNLGIYTAFSALLNQLVLSYFEGAQEDAGRMGMVMVVIGTVGQILIGVYLDKTHKYKEAAVGMFALCTLSLVGFLIALEMRLKWLTYLAICIFGLCLNAYLPVGYELGIELTYPSPESTLDGILITASQVLSVPLTMALSEITSRFGALYSIVAQCAILVLGTVFTCITPNVLHRQAAFKQGIAKEISRYPTMMIRILIGPLWSEHIYTISFYKKYICTYKNNIIT